MKFIGIMKDDLGGKLMIEFVALRAKMYAYKKLDKKLEDKCSKDTKKHIVAKRLTFDDYKTCLFKGETIYIEQMLFENKKYVVHTKKKHKIALNRDDDKRLIQADGVARLAR